MEVANTTEVVNREIRDTIFRDLFSQRKYLLDLYSNVCPDDSDATEDDIELLGIDRVIARGPVNDLSAVIRGNRMIFVEEQSDFDWNIPLRLLFYGSEELRRWDDRTNRNIPSHSAHPMPESLFFCVYAGERRSIPRVMRLSSQFSKSHGIELTVINITREEAKGHLHEYLMLIHIINEKYEALRRGVFPNKDSAAFAALDEAKARGYLVEYLEERWNEVLALIKDPFGLFDQKAANERFARELRQEITAEVTAEITAEVTAEVTAQVTQEVTAQVTEEVTAQVTEEVTAQVTEEVMAQQKYSSLQSALRGLRAGIINLDALPLLYPSFTQTDIDQLALALSD